MIVASYRQTRRDEGSRKIGGWTKSSEALTIGLVIGLRTPPNRTFLAYARWTNTNLTKAYAITGPVGK